MKNILVFATTFPSFLEGDATPGFVYDLSKRLQKLGLQIIVMTPRVPGSKKYEEKDGMKIYRFPYFFRSQWETLNDGAILPNIKKNKLLLFQVPFLLLAGFINLIKIVKKEKIDTIHAHWIIPGGFLSVLYKKIFNKNIKILCTSHGTDVNGLNGKIGTTIKKYVFKNIDNLTVVSNDLKNKCIALGMNQDKINVIPMGVDTELFSPDKYDESIKKKYNINGKFLLFVGRLETNKGVKYLIQSMKGLVEKISDIKLMIIGTGPLENELKKQVEELNILDNIIFTGPIQNKDLPKYYATSDIFVGPSLNEGFGIVFIEAILSGTIALGTKNGGIVDIIEEGKTGYFVEEKNGDEIQKIVLKIIDDIGFDIVNARELIKNKFSWEIISKKYFSLLNSD